MEISSNHKNPKFARFDYHAIFYWLFAIHFIPQLIQSFYHFCQQILILNPCYEDSSGCLSSPPVDSASPRSERSGIPSDLSKYPLTDTGLLRPSALFKILILHGILTACRFPSSVLSEFSKNAALRWICATDSTPKYQTPSLKRQTK